MTCFYCGRTISGSVRYVEWGVTRDHLYPRSMLRKLTAEQKRSLPKDFHLKNVVECCSTCNSMKGSLHPLDWLVIMPSNYCAARMAERMVGMGEDMEAVFEAMQRRKK